MPLSSVTTFLMARSSTHVCVCPSTLWVQVETGNPWFVDCSWFIGLIGLVSELPEIKGSQLKYSCTPPLVPTSL
jgi:hypothetical protein